MVLEKGRLPERISITKYSSIADAGSNNYSISDVKSGKANLQFKPIIGDQANLGFTKNTYWVKFQIQNNTDEDLLYYLKTAEPITDNVNLYLYNKAGSLSIQKSGDNLPLVERSVQHRETLFKIDLKAGETVNSYLEVKNDGEKNNLPVLLISQNNLLNAVYHEQIVFGFFYGILLIVAIIYFFFYFALHDKSFLYYSLYVGFVALCHFSLDGFFYQFVTQDNSWISLHAVIIFAILGSFFFGKYTEVFLNVKQYNPTIYKMFLGLYVCLALVLLGIIFVPPFLEFSYPIVNALTLVGMLLIVASVISLNYNNQPIDIFFNAGIGILFVCFTIAILLNFGVISLGIDNVTKLGIGLEVIALSLSMSNRIRLLKSDQEKLQTIALQRSQEMNEVKSYFLSNMSHELRTPLNAILGITNSMQAEATDPKIKANFETIKYVSHSLISSVNDILDFSKIEKGQLVLQNAKFEPLKILEEARISASIQAKDKGLAFEFVKPKKENIVVIGDAGRLTQIVNNILNNAIKFTDKGFIRFSIEFIEKSEDTLNLLIKISDTGIGITQEKISSIFNMFTQVDTDNKRKFGGFGIGLCVVKALVDLQKGDIKIDSKINEGTICTISLNYEIAPAVKVPVNNFPTDVCDLMGKNILIVEDNQLNQMVIKMMLKKWLNTTTFLAKDGSESLEVLKNENIDVVLMDLQMPVMDGYEATQAIRAGQAGEQNVNVPIIVLTADVMESTKERVFELGVNDFMTKPIDQNILYQKVTTVLSEVMV